MTRDGLWTRARVNVRTSVDKHVLKCHILTVNLLKRMNAGLTSIELISNILFYKRVFIKISAL